MMVQEAPADFAHAVELVGVHTVHHSTDATATAHAPPNQQHNQLRNTVHTLVNTLVHVWQSRPRAGTFAGEHAWPKALAARSAALQQSLMALLFVAKV